MAMVTAWNTQTKREQQVPAHWVGHPHLFGGIFRPLAERDDVAPAPKTTKKSRRQSAGAVETPTAVEAVPTESSPGQVGELENEEYSHGQ